jgi:hypothetical protein
LVPASVDAYRRDYISNARTFVLLPRAEKVIGKYSNTHPRHGNEFPLGGLFCLASRWKGEIRAGKDKEHPDYL